MKSFSSGPIAFAPPVHTNEGAHVMTTFRAPRPSARPPLLRFAACVAACASVLAGCVSDEKSQQKLPEQPKWARPTHLVINAEQPEDRNSDGYDDTIFVTVYVFDMDLRGQSIKVDCSYVFQLVDRDGKAGMEWEVPREVVNSAYRSEQPGPMVRLKLAIPQERAVALGGKPYTLLVKLISPDGQTIESGGGSSFTLRSKGR